MTKELHRAVRRFFANYEYKLHNVYMFNWECDFFAISKSGYCVEVEVKQSRSDFFADFKKHQKHQVFTDHKKPIYLRRVYTDHLLYGKEATSYVDENGRIQWPKGSTIDFHNPADHLPNKFYYACQDNLIKPHEVPAYAGLLYSDGNYIKEVKKAPFLHKIKNDHSKSLLSKYYHRDVNQYGNLSMLKYDLLSHLSEEGKQIFQNFLNKYHQ